MLVSLMIFGIGIVGPVADRLTTNPLQVMFYLFIAATVSVGMLLLTITVLFKFDLNEALTAGVLCGFRNVGLTFALIGGMAGSEFAIYVGVSQIPIFFGPLLIRLVTNGKTSAQHVPAA
jgi:BASS family bile acid:Na+ symporter